MAQLARFPGSRIKPEVSIFGPQFTVWKSKGKPKKQGLVEMPDHKSEDHPSELAWAEQKKLDTEPEDRPRDLRPPGSWHEWERAPGGDLPPQCGHDGAVCNPCELVGVRLFKCELKLLY